MLILLILLALFGVSITNVIAEMGLRFYRDAKFWISVCSILVLILCIQQSN